MNTDNLLDRCKAANLSLEETELLHLRYVGQTKTRPLTLRELAKSDNSLAKGKTPEGVSFIIRKIEGKLNG